MRARSILYPLAATLAALVLSGCSGGGLALPSLGDLNPFAETEERLPGERIAVLGRQEGLPGELAVAAGPVSLPPETSNAEWSQPGGVPSNAPGHLALASALQTAWTADAGSGSSKDGRLTVSPIIFGGRIFTMDTEAQVSAFSASGGSRQWRVSLVPEHEDEESGYGGGLAATDGRLVAATGFGVFVGLDPSNGAKLWETPVGVPIRSSPTAANGRVFAVAIDGRFFCIDAATGAIVWRSRGLPQDGSMLSNVSPAVDGDLVVAPFPSGEVVAVRSDTGEPIWSDSLARARSHSSLAALSDPARPVVDGGTVFAVGHAGRMIATEARSGARLWSQNVRGTQTPWVAGDAVYVVDVTGKLLSLSRKDGTLRWATALPEGGTWTGPVLAGGRLWLASSSGNLASVDATTGKVTATRNLDHPVFIAPIVAQGQLYVLTDKARLIALR
ncbi:MAG: PQQ-binding-like beta-propeller repeat protein [Rhizobiales bacterium]|nr:PQQ-binding-like beta-propeller repeat protein [Hyphomicrobiales bacterium]